MNLGILDLWYSIDALFRKERTMKIYCRRCVLCKIEVTIILLEDPTIEGWYELGSNCAKNAAEMTSLWEGECMCTDCQISGKHYPEIVQLEHPQTVLC